MSRNSKGFSLVELLVVVLIALLIMAYAVPSAVRMTHKMRLKSAAGEYQNLLQQTRVRAIQDDKFYQAKIQAATAATPNSAFIDLSQGNPGTYAAGYPLVSFDAEVVPSTVGPGGLNNLENQFLPVGSAAVVQANQTPFFSPRGLPCVPTVAGAYTFCNSMNSGQPAAYITYFQNLVSNDWMAVTVSPAARIRIFSYDQNTGTWTPMD
jgi:prepilin-type N-terminal cleavage/methylation domain-containing protein